MILKQGQTAGVAFVGTAVVASVLVNKFNSGNVSPINGSFIDDGFGRILLAASAADTDTLGPISFFGLSGGGVIVGQWNGVVLADYPSTGDPMAASVPGTYSPGQAGFLIGSALAALSGVLPATANAAIGVEVLDKANGIETGLTVRQALRLIAASLTGKLAIVGTTVTIKGAGVNTDRVAATTDAIGQRTAVTLTP